MQQTHGAETLTHEITGLEPLTFSDESAASSATTSDDPDPAFSGPDHRPTVDIREVTASVTGQERFGAVTADTYATRLMKQLSGIKIN